VSESQTTVLRPGVTLTREGLSIDGRTVPLYAGSVHYWRLDPNEWRACLEATKALGVHLVDTYIPWSVHEDAAGVLEFGQTDPRRDVARFIRLAAEVGLYVIARPGPHINAELTNFGIPDRVVWNPACQARSPRGNPVMLPMVPFAFPVPSYASRAFREETTRFFQALGPVLAPLIHPHGPVVLLQVDNEGALYFRDGAYDQDYHPDAIEQYRAFLGAKYGSIDELEAAYGRGLVGQGAASDSEQPRFAAIDPPKRFDATSTAELLRHLDWVEFQEHLLVGAFQHFRDVLADVGVTGVPTTHNFPPGQEATPLNASRVKAAVDLVGLDYYHAANIESRSTIARRTTELAVRSEGLGVPAFACELGAGFPPFFPPLDEQDSAFTVLAALAYGLRGFNIYMAVERDRWVGAPIDRHGRARPFATFWQKLIRALEATAFHSLERRTPVRIVIPRSERRLARVMHAFGPASGALFSVLGGGTQVGAAEDDLGLGYPIAIEADAFVLAVELALEERGVPFAEVGGEDREVSLDGARWIVCATGGGMNPGLFRELERVAAQGTIVTVGPRLPTFDGSMRPLDHPFDMGRLRPTPSTIAELVEGTPADLATTVARAIDALDLPTYACDPEGLHVTMHHDRSGRPKVLFVLNPGDRDLVARVPLGATVGSATDVIDEARFEVVRGSLEVRMRPRTARMIALETR